MAIYKESSLIWDYTPTSDVSGGDVVLLGPNSDIIGIVVTDIKANKTGTVNVCGAVLFDTEDSFSVGEGAYYNASSGKITKNTSDVYAGKVMKHYTSTSVLVDLTPPASASGVPVGSMLLFPEGITIPSGYVLTGTDLSRTTYAGLFEVLGTTYGEGDGSTTFGTPDQPTPTSTITSLTIASRGYFGMAADADDGIYLTDGLTTKDIYYSTDGETFNALSQTSRSWYGVCVAPNGDVYASVSNGDIYKRTGGTGDFVALGQTTRYWNGMAADADGNIYAAYGTTGNGNICMQTAGTGDFVSLAQSTDGWFGVCVAPNGDVYGCTRNSSGGGNIWIRAGGAGDFVDLAQTSRKYMTVTAAPNGDIYTGVSEGGIYMRSLGQGNFAERFAGDYDLLSGSTFTSKSKGYFCSYVVGGSAGKIYTFQNQTNMLIKF